MNFENYEGTAIDLDVFNQIEGNTSIEPMEGAEVEPEVPAQSEEVVETDDSEDAEITTEEIEDETSVYNIPGIGDVTADEIYEWRQGNLRQSDYTRKTQDLARQRDELRDAKELFDYISSNPHLIQALRDAEQGYVPPAVNNVTPERQMIRQLAYNQKAMETDLKLAALKQKYGEIDEVALFNKAAELRTEDLEFVYQGLQNEMNSGIDLDAIRQAAIEEAKAQLKAELENDMNAVGTSVSTKQSKPVENPVSLTAEQKRVAAAMGMSESEYAKWM